MASGYNRIVVVGNLTRDPEFKQLSSGQAVCRLGIALNRQFKNRQTGDMVQEVCYIDVDVWGPQAESCKQYLQKGRQALIEGRLKLDSWQDAEGNNRSKHSIVADRVVFLSSGNAVDDSQDEYGSDSKTGPIDPRNDVERELMSQLDQIKSRSGAATKTKKTASETFSKGTFQDKPPFDDLPF